MRFFSDKKTWTFMLTNSSSKGLAAVAQLYAIFVFTKVHTREDAAVIFLLLGYAIWLQVFEFGLAQALQNKFNAKLVTSQDMLRIIIIHFFVMIIIAFVIMTTPLVTALLLPENQSGLSGDSAVAFSLGASVLVIASNNVITQRFLLVFNKGNLGNMLIMSQSLLAIFGLAFYDLVDSPQLIFGVLLYLGPQILVYVPLLISLTKKLLATSSQRSKSSVRIVFVDALSFWGLGFMSVLYLGADYYFVAHYLKVEQIVSYHVVTRLFFISYVAYYAFLMHRIRRLSVLTVERDARGVFLIYKDSVVIGMVSVLTVFCVGICLETFGMLASLTNGVGISSTLIFSALLYFMVRVFRDVAAIIAVGLNVKKILFLAYLIELTIGLSLMFLLVPKLGGEGIFLSMSLASMLGFFPLMYKAKKLSTRYCHA